MALIAKLYLDRDIFFLILLRKIKKKMSLSKESFAASGGEILFTQPYQIKSFAAKPRILQVNRYKNSYGYKHTNLTYSRLYLSPF